VPGGTATAALDRAIGRYRDTSFLARTHVHGRAFLSDLAFVDRYVPRHGFIVDLGCGHGLFANLLAESSAGRRVLGVDVDERKIAVARETIDERESLRFELGDIVHDAVPKCDAVTIIDVLYLLPPSDQEAVLRKAASALAEGSKTDRERGETIARWCANPVERPNLLDPYLAAFLTKEGAARGTLITKAAAAKALPADPCAVLQAEGERILRLRAECAGVALVEATGALMRLGDALLGEYERRKRLHGLLDYDDLVQKTLELLRRPGVAP